MTHLAPKAAITLLFASFAVSALEARETWHEVRSEHFVVISNAGERRARNVSLRMEQFRYALSRILPNQPLHTEVPTQVYAFRDFDSFESFLPKTDDGVAPAAGYFREGAYKNVIALDLSAGERTYERIVFHEYVHLVLSLSGRDFPLWFEEGMAEFYASARLSDEGAELGVAEQRHRRVLLEHAFLPMEEILLADDEWTVEADPRDSALFYAQSWSFVHYLVAGSGADGHQRLSRYLSRLARGDDRLTPFQPAFGVTPDAMEARLRDYVEGGRFPHYRFEMSAVERSAIARVLTVAEVQHRWGELFLYTDRAREARVCLEEARRLAPTLSVVWETLGIAALMRGQEEDALAHFERAVERDDASPRALYEYARMLLRDYSGHGVTSLPHELADKAERALIRSLTLKPAQPETSRLLAFIYLVRGTHLREATELLESALAMTPGRPSLLYLYGQVLARRGDYAGARDALNRVKSDASEPALAAAAADLLSRLDLAERAP